MAGGAAPFSTSKSSASVARDAHALALSNALKGDLPRDDRDWSDLVGRRESFLGGAAIADLDPAEATRKALETGSPFRTEPWARRAEREGKNPALAETPASYSELIASARKATGLFGAREERRSIKEMDRLIKMHGDQGGYGVGTEIVGRLSVLALDRETAGDQKGADLFAGLAFGAARKAREDGSCNVERDMARRRASEIENGGSGTLKGRIQEAAARKVSEAKKTVDPKNDLTARGNFGMSR